MHDFIKFHYGPHWCLQFQGNTNNVRNNNRSNRLITPTEIQICLSQLPFLNSHSLSLRSCDALCCCEQVQVSEDLRLRLTENMTQCCQTCFIHHHQHRNPFLLHNTAGRTHFQDAFPATSTSTWSLCYLFAREKIVAQSRSANLIPSELIYFLKLLVSQYLQESGKSNHLKSILKQEVFYLLLYSNSRKSIPPLSSSSTNNDNYIFTSKYIHVNQVTYT